MCWFLVLNIGRPPLMNPTSRTNSAPMGKKAHDSEATTHTGFLVPTSWPMHSGRLPMQKKDRRNKAKDTATGGRQPNLLTKWIAAGKHHIVAHADERVRHGRQRHKGLEPRGKVDTVQVLGGRRWRRRAEHLSAETNA